jgi:hypothetical protein
VDPRAGLDAVENRKIAASAKIEPRFSGRLDRSLITILKSFILPFHNFYLSEGRL